MATLIDQDIAEWVKRVQLIEPFLESSLEPASYDISIGSRVIKHGSVLTLSDDNPTLKLEAGEFALLQSYELLNIPNELCGSIGIVSHWTKRGLISLIGPHLDPGFRGFLIVPAFNAGDSSISLNFKQPFLTVVFSQLTRNVQVGWSERRGKQVRMDVVVSPSEIRPNLKDLARFDAELKSALSGIHELKEKELRLSAQASNLDQKVKDLVDFYNMRLNRKRYRLSILAICITVALTIGGFFVGRYASQFEEFIFGGPTATSPTSLQSPNLNSARQLPREEHHGSGVEEGGSGTGGGR